MLGIAEYFWRLIPANPILLRVVQMNGKRRRDLFIRCIYLGLLIAVVVFAIATGNYDVGNLADLAKTSAGLFQYLSYFQLGLVALLAPVFTAGAITQERDSQTYDILLATPLTNGQIVLGSLLSRLFFVIALLISGIPVFSITQIFGGVAISSIVQAFGIAAATAFITGAIAMAIAVFKVGSRRTIFSFYLFVVAYVVGLYFLDQIPYFKISILNPNTNTYELSKTSWFTGLQPFLALRTIFHDKAYIPPALGDLPKNLQSWPIGSLLSNPAGFYTGFMFFLSFVLISPSMVFLRRLAQSNTSLRTWIFQKLRIGRGDRTRKPRTVWQNPIAWREAKTKGSASRATLLRYAFIGLGLAGAVVLVWMFATLETPKYPHFIDRSSLSADGNLLTVYDSTGSAPVTLKLLPDTQYMLNGKQVKDINSLSGHLMVQMSPQSVQKDEAGNEIGWLSINASDAPRRLGMSQTRTALLALTMLEFAVILLIVTNAAASTVTREKEDGTLDLLLTTPITSRYYIWGKLRGLVSFALPLVAVPVGSVAIFIAYDIYRSTILEWHNGDFKWIVFPEAVIVLPAMLIIVVAFAAILGMQMSLRSRKTVVAVMSSVGIVAGLCAGLGWCGMQFLGMSNSGYVGLSAASFSPFSLLMMMIDPWQYAPNAFSDPDTSGPRLVIFIFTIIAVAAYTVVVWSMYRSMVKNFDMTIRRQSR